MIKNVPKESVGMVLTDPPYHVLDSEHDIIGDKDITELSQCFFSMLQVNGKIAIFCSLLQIHKWNAALMAAGFKMQAVPIVVTHKPSGYFIF